VLAEAALYPTAGFAKTMLQDARHGQVRDRRHTGGVDSKNTAADGPAPLKITGEESAASKRSQYIDIRPRSTIREPLKNFGRIRSQFNAQQQVSELLK
jgi:hypothetical protein